MEPLITLNLVQLGWALGLVLLSMGLALWQQVGITWNLLLGSLRTIVQLLVAGYFLELVFTLKSPWLVIFVLIIMGTVATAVSRNRISDTIPQLWPWIGASLLVSTTLTLSYVIALILRPDPWYSPQYLIPLGGILLGNAMNASAIAGERFVSTLSRSQIEIETHLSLGASSAQATLTYRRDAIKAGMIPIINSMMVVGLVTLPGVMTGQILSGVAPINAVLYQILIMFILAFTNFVATLLIIRGVEAQFFTQQAQFKVPS
ncbi:MAG: iron export ABC transporter permease subunit FetB [Merismopedia sp. SIO2A8]|nr:iron export ABC transporter permease subunit FetB [Symploca sp. SIO2B6]NET54451.1 iron export ABC transporter permease subunit FetB [Merismopedia sp. SIO2A8]